MKSFILLLVFVSLGFAGRYYDPEVGIFTATDPAGQFFNAYGYGPGNPINGTDPTGMVWDYENMTLEELGSHRAFLENASGEALTNYLSIHDAPEIFRHIEMPNLPGEMAFVYQSTPNYIQYIAYRSIADFQPHRLAHEVTHANDFVVRGLNPYLPGTSTLNIMHELSAMDVQLKYMQAAGMPITGIAKYYQSNLGMSQYNQGRMLLDWRYRERGYGISNP